MLNQRFATWGLGCAVLVLGVVLNTAPAVGQDLAGQWSGYWQSDANGHQGCIRATFCQISACQVEAKFSGTFAKILPFRYRTRLNIVHQEPGMMLLSGSRRLPFSGEFRYDVEIRDGQFLGTFSSPRNSGTWVMSRY